MRHERKEGFTVPASAVVGDILIPRFYDPRITDELKALSRSHTLSTIDNLVAAGHLRHDHGSYVPKIYYGTGSIPYIRTSDLANWEVKASPKHGVSQDVYDEYGPAQDVRAEDILFVHEGTYLIGTAAMTTRYDGPMLYQHHLAKFRVLPKAPFGPYFLLAALEALPVQRQIRSKQFSADIIDSVVGRLGQVVIPVPKDRDRLRNIEAEVSEAIIGRAEIKEQLAHVLRELDPLLQGESTRKLDAILAWRPSPTSYEGQTVFLNYRSGFSAFSKLRSELRNDVLLPKYYDPHIIEVTSRFKGKCRPTTIGELVADGIVALKTGDEIGRISYGSGDIPFVRTSDFGSWELKREAKQGVSQDVYDEWAPSQDVQADDILLVRDGTYLVGTSVLVCETDLPLLFSGGIICVRSLDHKRLPPALLFALLNLPTTRRQLRNKQFTRDVIDTLGNRLSEVILPIPKDAGVANAIEHAVSNHIKHRNALRVGLAEIVEAMYNAQAKLHKQGSLFENARG